MSHFPFTWANFLILIGILYWKGRPWLTNKLQLRAQQFSQTLEHAQQLLQQAEEDSLLARQKLSSLENQKHALDQMYEKEYHFILEQLKNTYDIKMQHLKMYRQHTVELLHKNIYQKVMTRFIESVWTKAKYKVLMEKNDLLQSLSADGFIQHWVEK